MSVETSVSIFEHRLHQVLKRIERVAKRSRRDPDSVRLVVVTKTRPVEVVQAVVAAGAHYLGENYAEEAVPKILSLGDESDVEWHMIGHVQSRKALLVCEYFDYMHSLDSLKLAHRLETFAGQKNRKLPVLLECNLSGEETKYGWPIWQGKHWESFLPVFEQIVQLPHLEVRGLMGMAPYFSKPEPSRPYYRLLREFQDFLKKEISIIGWDELSMGMSGDFEVAIEEGATWVRIGQYILGPRHEKL